MENINQLLDSLNIQQLVISALALSAGGIVGFWFRDFPKKLLDFIINECTCRLNMTSHNMSFNNAMKYFSIKLKDKRLKSYKAISCYSRSSDKLENNLSLGYGRHLLWFYGCPLLITLIKEENNHQIEDKDRILIQKIGRSKKVFEKLLKEIDVSSVDTNAIDSYTYSGNYWRSTREIQYRDLDTVFMNDKLKNKLILSIDKFIGSEDWYTKTGIPYHLGILLYGPPGTGKTSFIKAIATYTGYGIAYLPCSNLSKIQEAIQEIPKKTILVIEDIDCQSSVRPRTKDTEEYNNDDERQVTKTNTDDSISALQEMSLSNILNSLDGLISAHGYIFIATTNHIEKLDSALIRPGRIDLCLEVGYVTLDVLNQFLTKYYDTTTDVQIRNNITTAELQQKLLENYTADEIIEWAKL